MKPTRDYLHNAMRDLFSRYAMRFNRKYQRKGHLFGGPYRQSVCLDESYLLAVSLYIHLNPCRAGITRDPLKYRWSSCALYCRQNSPKSFVDPNFILDMLSSEKAVAKKTYRNLLKKGLDMDIKEVMEDKNAIEQLTGHISSLFPSLFRKVEKKKRITRSVGIDLISLDHLEKQIVLMKSNKSRKPETIAAKKYLVGQLISRGYSRKEVAQRLGISRKGVYNFLKSSKSPLQ
jgi:putative transposase